MEDKQQKKGPNLKALGFNNPMEIIDLLALLKVDGEPIIKDDKAWLDQKLKAQLVMEYFLKTYKIKPDTLPYVGTVVKRDIKQKKLAQRSR